MSSVDDLLAAARSRLDRVTPERLGAEMADGAIVVDTRPVPGGAAHCRFDGQFFDIDATDLDFRIFRVP